MGIPLIGTMSRSNRAKVALFSIGVDNAKDNIYSRLLLEDKGPGYCHFPRELDRGYDEKYFHGLVAERKKTVTLQGRDRVMWILPSGARNEPLDCRNYATAALEILKPDFGDLRKLREKKATTTGKQRRKQISRGITV